MSRLPALGHALTAEFLHYVGAKSATAVQSGVGGPPHPVRVGFRGTHHAPAHATSPLVIHSSPQDAGHALSLATLGGSF